MLKNYQLASLRDKHNAIAEEAQKQKDTKKIEKVENKKETKKK